MMKTSTPGTGTIWQLSFRCSLTMDVDGIETAATESPLSESSAPATLIQFRTQLQQAKTKLDLFQKSWEQHLKDIKLHASNLKEQHSATLTANAWASPAALSSALNRLEAYDILLNKRIQPLSSVFKYPTSVSILELVRSATTDYRPIGPETRLWQLNIAISAGEVRMIEVTNRMEKLEYCMGQLLQMLLDSDRKLTIEVDSPQLALACEVATKMEILKDLLNGSTAISEIQRGGIDSDYEQGMMVTKIIRAFEGKMNILHWRMSKLGMKTARQTVMFEYCELPQV